MIQKVFKTENIFIYVNGFLKIKKSTRSSIYTLTWKLFTKTDENPINFIEIAQIALLMKLMPYLHHTIDIYSIVLNKPGII